MKAKQTKKRPSLRQIQADIIWLRGAIDLLNHRLDKLEQRAQVVVVEKFAIPHTPIIPPAAPNPREWPNLPNPYIGDAPGWRENTTITCGDSSRIVEKPQL